MLRAEELMVGDLVRVNRDGLCIKNGTIVKVLGVDSESKLKEKGLIGHVGCQPMDKEQFCGGIWLDYLDPIPLTPEILEKNGFGKIYDDELLTRLVFIKETTKIYNTSVIISLYKEPIAGGLSLVEIDTCPKTGEGLNHIHVCDILHVHELQHALRLCGINKTIEL